MSNFSNPYTRRDSIIRQMGYVSYKAYLASSLWKAIRDRVMARDKGQCRVCDNKSTECHHRNYDAAVLSGRVIDSIVSICRQCHASISVDESGLAVSLDETERRLAALLGEEAPQWRGSNKTRSKCRSVDYYRAKRLEKKINRKAVPRIVQSWGYNSQGQRISLSRKRHK